MTTRPGPAPDGGLRAFLRRLFGRRRAASPVADEWEWYARDYREGRVPRHGYLGEDWNDPRGIGVDLPPERVVPHILETAVLPFLGTGPRLLEIGCGAGRFTLPLAERFPVLVAADTSPTMLRLLRERLPAGHAVEPLLLDGRGLAPVPDASVDAAFSYDVFVHLEPHDIYLYVRELRRVLRKGGRAVLHHGNALSELGWAKFERDHAAFAAGQPGKGCFTLMTPDLFRTLAERAGLTVHDTLLEVVRRDAITRLSSD